jgi:hypothetical protein
MIQMVTQGIKPPQPAAPASAPAPAQAASATATAEAADEAPAGGAADKKGKKDREKHVRMVYSDAEFSPEERMVRFARYAWAPEAA